MLQVHSFVQRRLGYWPLTQDSKGATRYHDASGNKRHLSITGAPSSQAGPWGGTGRALGFTASDDLATPTTTALTSLGAFTIAAWLYPTNLDTNYIYFGWGSVDNAINFRLDPPTNGLRAQNRQSAANKFAAFNYATDGSFGLNAWYHVCWVFDGLLANNSRWKLWISGKSKAVTVDTGTYAALPNPGAAAAINVSSNNIGTQDYLGYMAQVSIWSRALTAEEVVRHAESRF